MQKMPHDDVHKKLTPEQFNVLHNKQTEAPFSGKFLYNDEQGTYTCAQCGNVLFDSDTKFEAHCGWPNFNDAIKGSVTLTEDDSWGMMRTEVTCAKCGGHLGHVFDDSPEQPTGQRFCINSAALEFLAKDTPKT